MSNLFRQIPAVDKLLEEPAVKQAAADLSHPETTAVIRQELERIRAEIAREHVELSAEEITSRVVRRLEESSWNRLQPVINATGVLIHTNVGRAPLPAAALERL